MSEMYIIKEKENFIGEYEIDTSICDEIVEYFKKSDRKEPGKYGDHYTLNKETKDSLDAALNDDDLAFRYCAALQKALDKYVDTFPFAAQQGQFIHESEPNIQYYEPGGGFKAWHAEADGSNLRSRLRHLVYMTYLNDVPDGGTEFVHQQLTTSAIKGKTLIWPAEWTYTHRGQITNKHEKYIITGWFRFIGKEELEKIKKFQEINKSVDSF